MNINKEKINKALQFYEINDEEYKNKCYSCLNFVNENINFKNQVNKIFNILYNGKDEIVNKIWKIKSLDELFCGNYHSYITNLLLLSGYEIHKANMEKYKLEETQITIHKNRVKEALTNDIYVRKYDGIRISQMLWGTYFSKLKIIEVGRLQFEFSTINPYTKQDEKCIKIHIPAGSKLNSETVKDSLSASKKLIMRYFNICDFNYYCNSWLLSKEIYDLLEPDSNIRKFYHLFDIMKGDNCIDNVLNFVYNIKECDNYANLQEQTFLQKSVKSALINGKIFYSGFGCLKQ